MESLKLSFEAIAPIFLLMLLGYVLKTTKVADKKTFDAMNKLVFRIFLPILLFYNIYKTESAEILNGRLMILVIIGVLLVFVLGYGAVFALTRDNAKRGVILQSFFRSNYAILGITLVDYICHGQSTGLASLLVAVVVPLFNVLGVIALERFKATDDKLNLRHLLSGIAKNPLIIGCLVGLFFFLLKIPLPSVAERAVADVSKIASPLAIVVLGASFTFSSVRGYWREILVIVLTRLVLVPIFALTIGVLLGFTGEALACLLIIFGGPVAVSAFAMAQQMGGDEALAAHAVVFTSAGCLLTLFVWIFVLNQLALF